MSSVFDPGKKDRQRAAGLADQGLFTGGSATGPGGISAGFDFSNNRATVNSSLGDFAPLMQQLIGTASGAFNQAGGGLPPELMALGQGTIDQLGQPIDANRLQNQSDFEGLGKIFESAAATAQKDPFDLGQEVSSRLHQLSQRREQRATAKMFDKLKASGKLGTSGGAGIASEFDMNLQDAALKRDLAGLDFGQRSIQDAFGRALGASGQREAIGAREFGETFAMDQAGRQSALQQFGVGSSMFDQFLKNQLQGTNIGLAATQGAAGLSQLPLAFLNAMQGAGGQASNTYFAASGINAQNAANARSPFLDVLNAAGGFMTGMGDIGIGS
jgi:hypothetical protein